MRHSVDPHPEEIFLRQGQIRSDCLVSVVSPVYGCKDCIATLCESVRVALEERMMTWELILVDDRSPEDAWGIICREAEHDERVKGIRLSRNHGQHLAIWAGMREAKGDWVVVIDCDLQDDPSFIPELISYGISESLDAVTIDRGIWSDSWTRRLFSSLFYKILYGLTGLKINNSGNFGAYRRRFVEVLLSFKEQEVFLPMMASIAGFRQGQIRRDRSARISGKSSYKLTSLLRLAISILVRFSDRPLKLSILVGVLISLISVVVSIFLVIGHLSGVFQVPGWASITLSVWFLSGLILATLGVHGFYIAKIFAEVRGRPRITVESRTGDKCPN